MTHLGRPVLRPVAFPSGVGETDWLLKAFDLFGSVPMNTSLGPLCNPIPIPVTPSEG